MFRIEKFNQRSVTEIQIKFSQSLDTKIGISNIRISSNVPNIPDLVVKSLRIKRSVLSIITAPQLSMVLYSVEFISTPTQTFQSVSGETLQNSNTLYFIGQEKTNDVRDAMLGSLSQVYNTDRTTFVRKIVSNLADNLLRGRTSVLEIGNANYISEEIVDEIKTRSFGPTDRLDNESAYEILRVAKTPTGTSARKALNFNTGRAAGLVGESNKAKANTWLAGFPSDPLSLQGLEVLETISNAETIINHFDGLLITVAHSDILVVNSVKLRTSAGTEHVYDLPRYHYALLENRYDTVFARKLLTLEANQIKLAEAAVLEGSFPVPSGDDELVISYVYRDAGLNVDPATVAVSQLVSIRREAVPGQLNVFGLEHFPIVDSADQIATSGGVDFLDPNPAVSAPFSQTHPSFRTEITFSLSNLPSEAGQYAVDYTNGQVYVFSGTTSLPPVADYLYRKVYKAGLDYTFDADTDEIVALASRDLAGEDVKVSFEYERVFAPGVDFEKQAHIEVINEYVENRFNGVTALVPQKRPITDVFEVINETTGEAYIVNRFDDNYIYITGVNLPRFVDQKNETADFKYASNETIFVAENLHHDIIKIKLLHENIIALAGSVRAANVNTSAVFTRTDIFEREFYYDSVLQGLSDNLSKLGAAGDYLIDAEQGIVYCKVAPEQDGELGSVSYRYGVIATRFPQIVGIDQLAYRKTLKNDPAASLDFSSFSSEDIEVSSVPEAVERFYDDDTDKPILFGSVQFGVAGQMHPGSYEFVALDGNFDDSMLDGYHILRIPGEPDRALTSITSSTTLLVDIPFAEFNVNTPWYLIDFELTDGYRVVTSHDIAYVRAVYLVEELQTLDAASLTNYYDPLVDTFSGNLITFNNDAIKAIPAGTALAIDYSFGNLWVDYKYAKDVLRISYEYGDNSLDFGGSDVLAPGDTYYATYRFGALREKLLENFGSLTQLADLTTLPIDLDRELYRNFLLGTLQAFLKGPTNESIKSLVESVTGITPTIRELAFNEWVLGRDNLYLLPPKLTGPEDYDSGRWGLGLALRDGNTLVLPGESYVSFKEGTFETWLKPFWSGQDNDASLTFTVNDGYENVFIGAKAFNPPQIPFELNRADDPDSPIGQPVNFRDQPGHYVWFDDLANQWNYVATKDGYGSVTTSGEFYKVSDGYRLASTQSYLKWDGYSDEADGYLTSDGYTIRESFTFNSDNLHRIFDTGPSLAHNRLTFYKDGTGFLNFRIYDDLGRIRPTQAKFYNVSASIEDWVAGDLHFLAVSWRLNSAEGIDEMHLFIDGQEVSNVFKYGGRPPIVASTVYRSVANEVLTSSAPKTIIGALDGITNAGSATFASETINFSEEDIDVGDELTILDDTADGTASPYTIVSIAGQELGLNAPLTLSLEGVSFTINQFEAETSTNVDVDSFAVFAVDGYESRELHSLAAEIPDYSVERVAGTNTIFINNGVSAGEEIIINTLGLTQGRCRDVIFLYEDGYSLTTRGAPPSSLEHVDIYKINFKRISIEEDGYSAAGDGYGFFALSGSDHLTATFTNISQPSNSVTGKKIAVTVGGTDNMNFGLTNAVTVNGTTYDGYTSETVSFSDFGTQVTDNYFLTITSLAANFHGYDGYVSMGSLELVEAYPLTSSENNGEYAIISEYDNGTFLCLLFGGGGDVFELSSAYYLLDYPVSLNIPLTQKGPLYLGSSLSGTESLEGVLDQTIFLNEMLEDIRSGEDPDIQRSVTQDFNSPVPLEFNAQTLMMLNFNGAIENVSQYFKTFDTRFLTSSRSVNSDFGDSVVFLHNDPLVIDNSESVFNNDAASIEFWVSPYIDTKYDNFNRYYIDLTSMVVNEIVSDTTRTLTLPRRARKIVSVRLASDRQESGTDYFEEGKLFVNGRTVFLGTALPAAMTLVRVVYVPIDAVGDRVSVFKNTANQINFAVTTEEQEFVITIPIDWARNTWHRVMVTLKANSRDGQDRMKMLVDGSESGILRWGTPGIKWGTGKIWGEVNAGNQSVVDNIDLVDTFGEIFVGNSFDRLNPSKCRMDNLRFSNIERPPSLIGLLEVDLNYNANNDSVSPVTSDDHTTTLLDFNKNIEETEFLTNLLSKYTPLFLFDVEVDDAFRRLTDERSRMILTNILRRMKQSHTNIFVKYLQELI